MLPFPASLWWSLCSESFLWALGRASSCWGRNCRRLAWETHCWVFLPPYSVSTSDCRNCYEGESRNFTACCGLLTLLGDPSWTWWNASGRYLHMRSTSWACCLQLCIIPLWICCYHSPLRSPMDMISRCLLPAMHWPVSVLNTSPQVSLIPHWCLH